MKKVVSFITAGHSPREDIAEELKQHLSEEIEVRQRGALDHLSVKEVREKLAPLQGEPILTSRLSDKSMADFSKAKVMPLLLKAVNEESSKGADIIVILCTSAFDEIPCFVPVIIPFHLLRGIVTAVKADCNIGALFPFQQFAEQMQKDWETYGISVRCKCAAPNETNWDKYVDFFKKEKTELLIMDCIGYTYECRDYLAKELNIPVIHPRTLIISAIHSLLCLS